ncbi:helix-hairpin-helix domain-containing protein [Terrisporobacter sp.]
MNKKKIIIFALILLICPTLLIIKDGLISKEEVYVLTDDKNSPQELSNKKSSNTNIKKEASNISNKEITVYVSGAVKKAGVVTLKAGDRLAKAVEKLGGTTKKADLNQVNLAIRLEDEKHYIIPKLGEKISNEDSAKVDNNTSQSSSEESNKVNINTATIEQLDKLPGVGEATANKIVNHRSENGNFKSVEEIKNVNGIGDKKFEDMKELICVN